MLHDSWLKVRISGVLLDGLRAKYGRGVSKVVRGMIERDLGFEKKSDADALEKSKMTWKEKLAIQRKADPSGDGIKGE